MLKQSLKILLLCSVGFTFPAYGQAVSAGRSASADEARGLDEIVVTARRRSETLLDVPVAVSALSRQTLDRAHVTDVTQIAEMTPNVMIVPSNSGSGGAMAIRGIGSSGADPGIEQSVGINIDGVSVGRGRIIQAGQFDLKQVEVLKGPQALFFGKNSPAGVISITTADPTSELRVMGRIGYEFESDERYAEGYVSGPLSDTLGFRLAAKYSDMDGWLKNNAVGGIPNLAFPGFTVPGPAYKTGPATRSFAGRVTLKWDPTTDFSATLKFLANKADGNGDDAVEHYCSGPAARIGFIQARSLTTGQVVTDPRASCPRDQHVTRGGVPEPFRANWPAAQKHNGQTWHETELYLGSLTMNYNFGDVALTSVTGFTKLIAESVNEASGTSFATVISNPYENSRTLSQELRLSSDYEGPLNFTFGAYFEDSKRTNTYNPYLAFAGFDATNGGSMYTFRGTWRNKGKTYSSFGQLRWKIVDELELSGGVRYTKESKNAQGQNLYVNGLGLTAFRLAPVGRVVAKKTRFTNWSPEVTLAYKPTPGVMTYLAYKTGYKSGGLSTPATISGTYLRNDPVTGAVRPAGQGPDLLAFAPEKSKGFEGGIKAELLDRTLRVELTAYRYTFTNLQLTALNSQIVAYFVRNAGKARTSGIEGSLSWRVLPELSFNFTSAYNKAKYVSFTGAQCYQEIYATPVCPLGAAGSYDRSGQVLPRAPKYSLSGSFDYEREIGSDMKMGVGGEAIFTGDFQTHDTGAPAGINTAFWRLNASVRIGAVDDKWELALIGRNLTNHYYFLLSTDKVLSPAGNHTSYSVRPRQIALQGTVKF